MRWILTVVAIIGAGLAAAWLGGETVLARKAGQFIADDPRIDAASVSELRDWRRVGLALDDVRIDTDNGPARLSGLTLWAAPTRLNEMHLSLPARVTLPVAGQPRQLDLSGAEATMRVSPANAMAVTEATAASGPVTVDGAALLDGLSAQLRMVTLGVDAPGDARAAYLLTLDADGVDPVPLLPQAAALPGPLGVAGAARLWLTAPIRSGGAQPGPQLAGAASDGITVTLGDLSARLAGRVQADAQGFASGDVYLYTADARGFLTAAADAGLIPPGSVPLADTVLTGLGTDPAGADLPIGAAAPAPRDGELRLPITLADGRMTLRGVPLGPAPRLR